MKKAMTKLLTVLLSIGMVISLVTACGKDNQGELNVAIGYQLTTLDPAFCTEISNFYLLTNMYAGLFRKDENGEVVHDLCQDYEVSDNGLIYTFHIVSDAKWSDGKPVTAYDFEYSCLRALSYGEDNGLALYMSGLSSFIEGADAYNEAAILEGTSFDCTTADHSYVGIEAVDDTTLVLTLAIPCTYLTSLMTSSAWLPVREDFALQHDSMWAFEGGYPITGAYSLVECNETEKAVLTKNEQYRFADDVSIETINVLCMPDKDAQAMAYQAGEIDIALDISAETAKLYENSSQLQLMLQPSNYFLAINSGSSGPDWAKDVKVRRALALAIDKDQLVEFIGGAEFYPVLNGYVPEGIAGIEDSFRAEGDADGYTLTYNPEQAKALLAEAGYNDSHPLEIVYKHRNSGIHGDVAKVLEQMWTAVGIKVDVQSMESGIFFDQTDQGNYEIAEYGYAPTDSAIQYLELWTTAWQITPAVDSPEFDKMIDDARTIKDPVEFNNALHAAEDYLVEENVFVIPLFNFNTPALVKDYVKGFSMSGAYPFFANITIEK